MVASDPRRPFRVEAGEHTITAVGTSFNVDFLDKYMQVAMVEGKVAVSVAVPSGASGGVSGKGLSPAFVHRTIDLIEGQELRVEPDGRALLVPESRHCSGHCVAAGDRDPQGHAAERCGARVESPLATADQDR